MIRSKYCPSRFISAPMAGITDYAFRKLIRLFFDGLIFTEMISIMALKYNYKREIKIAKFLDMERPVGLQIFGKDPEVFNHAARLLNTINPNILDINFGCPARKVVSSGSGSALLRDKVLAKEIIDSTLEGFNGPVSFKMRILDEFDIDKTLNFIDFVASKEISFITVHLRTPKDKFNKKIDYDLYKDLYNYKKNRIVINGGIDDQEKVLHLHNLGGKYYMIGQAVLGKPHIFQIIDNNNKINYNQKYLLHLMDYLDISLNSFDIRYIPYIHLLLLYKEKKEQGLKEFRKHFCWYTKGMNRAKEYRNAVFKTDDYEYLKEFILRMINNAG